MSHYRKFVIAVMAFELVLLCLLNLCDQKLTQDHGNRLYRVEAGRVADELVYTEADEIDLSKYETIVGVVEFVPDAVCNEDYVIARVNGQLYQIQYQATDSGNGLLIMDLFMIVVIILSLFLLWYVGKKVLRPFWDMRNLPYELAKGNLSVPIKEEKSKYFGKFLWGMDMLREKLEEDKARELTLQREKKLMVLSLSHDIKTPLSAIELYTKALSEKLYDTEEKREEVLRGIEKNSREIRGYVDEIMMASREDFLNLEVSLGECYLSEIIKHIEHFYREKLTLIHTEFVIEACEDCLIKADSDRLVEVLQNIMENAIKYGDGKHIGISFSEEENCRLISVENSGNTLKEEELAAIFDSFYRGSNSRKIQGSGLGLYICKNLMRKMEGDVFGRIRQDDFIVTIVVQKA